MPLFTFGPWRPDLPDVAQLDDTGSLRLVEATNIVPGVGCYHPQPSTTVVTDSLTITCQGAFACTDRDGNVNWFAGTATDLKRISSNTSTWSTVGAGFGLSDEERWEFVRWGNQVFATSPTDDLQYITLEAGAAFAPVAGVPPRFRHLGIVKNFMVGVGTDLAPQRVQWSGIDNPQTWTVDATTMADFQDLLGPGGWNQGIITGLAGADAVIMQEHSVWRMMYVGLPLVFQFDPVESARGAIAAGSIVQSAGFAFYYSDDGFYQFDGTTSRPIGNGKVDEFFGVDSDDAYLNRVTAVADVDRSLVMWSYRSVSANTPDRILVYNWQVGEWTLLEQTCELLWRSLRRHSTPYGLPDLSIFTTANRAATFTSTNLAARLTTAEYQLNPSGRILLTELHPILETGSPITYVQHRVNPTVTITTESAITINAYGFAPLRVDDRMVRFTQEIPASTWDKWRGFKLVYTSTGRR